MTLEQLKEEIATLLAVAADLAATTPDPDPFSTAVANTTNEDTNINVVKMAVVAILNVTMDAGIKQMDAQTTFLEAALWVKGLGI